MMLDSDLGCLQKIVIKDTRMKEIKQLSWNIRYMETAKDEIWKN